MMLDNANIFKARGFAVQGAAFGVFLLVFALITFRLGRFEVALTFIPLVAVYLWPRHAATGLSSALIFLLGMAVDILSGGPVGLWAFIYLALYGVFRPDLRGRDKGLGSMWGVFCFWVAGAMIITLILGAIFVSGRTGTGALALQAIVALILFPVLYVLNKTVIQIFVDEDSAEAGL